MNIKCLLKPAWVYSIFLFLLFTSCEKFEFSPNEVRLQEEEKDLTRKNLERIQALQLQNRPAFRFAIISDTQRFYDELDDAAEVLKNRNDIDFIVLTGDISDFGTTKEFRWVHERLLQTGKPYLTVIGNHDCVGNGKKIYQAMYGPYDYSMNIGRNRFVFINTNSREFDEIVPDLNSFRNLFRNSETFDQAFVFSHVPPFDEDFNQSLVADFTRIVRENKVKLSAHGHQHNYKAPQVYYNDEVPYLIVGAIEKRGFEVVTVAPSSVQTERVNY